MRFQVAQKLEDRCRNSNFCENNLPCSGINSCIGCGVCVDACPYEARVLKYVEQDREYVKVWIDGEAHVLPERITILRALEMLGFKVSRYPGDGDIYAPCRTGGCWACAVIINGQLKPSCTTSIYNEAKIVTGRNEKGYVPFRLVSGFHGHSVGGVGTPHWIKPRGVTMRYIEVACFAHGCILRCPTCQNWEVTYSSSLKPLSPIQAARLMTAARMKYGVDRLAISGGECTLNRRWLLDYIRELRALNQEEKARIHVDTNAVVLTEDYINELVEAGMTDIGPDVKALRLETFLKISRLNDKELANKLLTTEWKALKYLLDKYWGKIFIGIGIPYNPMLISMEEVREIGERIAGWEPNVQVCALDYRPEFRRRDISKPSYGNMVKVKQILEKSGLRCVICQTEYGHVGP
ncbi:MAG: radical SAM protein [Nitrososphaeria archaeon]|nr:radical SAM protein [Nitrososphaeria archaeon]NIQ32278.1 radical SAM protein [Nitrososphaeria archaeon]